MYLFVILWNVNTATILHGFIAATLHEFVTGFEQDGKIKVNKNLVLKDNDYFRYRPCSGCLPRMPATSCSNLFVIVNMEFQFVDTTSEVIAVTVNVAD